mmetsp:Transcript_5802/g.22002  ORF Transcript_5802/g.22002 Transcript_5802/m.22002 type:complete len:565 (-) Transcript_5802:38-1732(-)
MYTSELDSDLSDDATKLAFLKDTVFPKAVANFAKLLTVVPVQGNLTLDRQCGSFYPDTANEKRQCSSYNPVTCGDFGSIPAEHYSSQPIYSAPGVISGNTTGGPGIPNTDVVIYVTAKQTATCVDSTSTLAYAAYCVMDTKDRPVAGYVNFCKNNIGTTDVNKAVITTMHEVGHALAYSSSLYPYFRRDDGTAYTKRRLTNSGPYIYDHGTPPSTPSDNTLETFTERGNSVQKLVLSKAVEKAREHFGCDTLNGVELENQGGSGTQTSHPEMRIYFNDFMNGQYPAFPVVSKTTLAVFESSGWYKANYDNADFHSWGYKQGCNFATEKCISSGKAEGTNHFCTSTGQEVRCAQNLRGFGLCSTTSYTSDLPASYQYFSNAKNGGSTSLMDYCPVYDTFNWQSGGIYPAGQSLCTNPDGGPSQNTRGENYGSNSRCAVNTLLGQQFSGESSAAYGGCFQFDCRASDVRVLIGDTFVKCGKTEAGVAKSATGFKGNLYCPDYDVACPSATSCDLDCGDHGACIGDVCSCVKGWDGNKCQYQRNSASLYGISLVVMIIGFALQLIVM